LTEVTVHVNGARRGAAVSKATVAHVQGEAVVSAGVEEEEVVEEEEEEGDKPKR
jgi:hypothetical protein